MFNIKQCLVQSLKILLFSFLFCWQSIPCQADTVSEKAMYKKIFTNLDDASKIFHSTFLSAVSDKKIRELVDQFTCSLGKYQDAKGAAGSYILRFKKGTVPSKISLNEEGLVTHLTFEAAEFTNDTPAAISAGLKALPGFTSVTILKNGREKIFELNSNQPLGIGSAFKLYVLKAITQKVEKGELSWNKIVHLTDGHMSLPSGILQDWPVDTPITVRTLCNLMISLSDNTATDHLLFLAGRENVESLAPERIRPFLSTLEIFKLKWGISKGELDSYIQADLAGKRAFLDKIACLPREQVDFVNEPRMIDQIEWLTTTDELCRIIFELNGNPSISINPGLGDRKKWQYIGYKGGSEPGVLNYTHILRKGPNTPFYCISATINDPKAPVKEEEFTDLIVRLFKLLEQGKI
ncbi:MAG: serine hydrolase [Candidatus Wallbacteria bacterium]|nr:serine hydrolase [Candidatus Wallbacteria bacterium]